MSGPDMGITSRWLVSWATEPVALLMREPRVPPQSALTASLRTNPFREMLDHS
jgi:hypothetical protein